jgi:hypothetical protein
VTAEPPRPVPTASAPAPAQDPAPTAAAPGAPPSGSATTEPKSDELRKDEKSNKKVSPPSNIGKGKGTDTGKTGSASCGAGGCSPDMKKGNSN